MEYKTVNTKYSLQNIERIKLQSVANKRTFQAELELILDSYFQNKADEKAFKLQDELMKKGEF